LPVPITDTAIGTNGLAADQAKPLGAAALNSAIGAIMVPCAGRFRAAWARDKGAPIWASRARR